MWYQQCWLYCLPNLGMPFQNVFFLSTPQHEGCNWQTRCSWGCSTDTLAINSFINKLIRSPFSSQSSKDHKSQTVAARDFKFWNNGNHPMCVMIDMPCVRCHMSGVRCHKSPVTPKPEELGSWHFRRRVTSSHLSPVKCHLSCVMLHMSCVFLSLFLFLYKVVKLFNGGFVIN